MQVARMPNHPPRLWNCRGDLFLPLTTAGAVNPMTARTTLTVGHTRVMLACHITFAGTSVASLSISHYIQGREAFYRSFFNMPVWENTSEWEAMSASEGDAECDDDLHLWQCVQRHVAQTCAYKGTQTTVVG